MKLCSIEGANKEMSTDVLLYEDDDDATELLALDGSFNLLAAVEVSDDLET